MATSHSLTDAEAKVIQMHLAALPKDHYPFRKPEGHFVLDQKEQKGISTHHSITLAHKRPKVTGSEARNTHPWLLLKNEFRDKKLIEVNIRFIILMGEILRFVLDGLQPKYREVRKADASMELYTKQVKSAYKADWFDYLADFIYQEKYEQIGEKFSSKAMQNIPVWKYKGNDFIEGIVAAHMVSLIYLNDDLNGGNGIFTSVAGIKKLVMIDLDRMLWTFSAAFFTFTDTIKRTNYCSENIKAEPWTYDPKRQDFVEWSRFPGMTTDECLEQHHEDDYVGSPFVTHFLPTSWQLNARAMMPYAKALAQSEIGRNENPFFRLKSILTLPIQHFLIEYHWQRKTESLTKPPVVFSEWEAKFRKTFMARLGDVEQFAHVSPQIHDYLTSNRMTAIKAILFEVNAGFYEAKHYFPRDRKRWDQIWAGYADLIIGKFERILAAQQLAPLVAQERRELQQFAAVCDRMPSAVMTELEKFYQGQKRICARLRLQKTASSKKRALMFDEEKPLPPVRLHKQNRVQFFYSEENKGAARMVVKIPSAKPVKTQLGPVMWRGVASSSATESPKDRSSAVGFSRASS